jgi:hypothetical protein
MNNNNNKNKIKKKEIFGKDHMNNQNINDYQVNFILMKMENVK